MPKAEKATGLVTTGPYRRVRHPIYLGLVLVTMGQALAFRSWPAVVIVLFGIVPTFAWRARAEETLLTDMLGERYAVYRQRTQMIVQHPFGREALARGWSRLRGQDAPDPADADDEG